MSTSAIAMSGLATGIDTSSVVNSLMAIEKQPLQQLQSQQQAEQTRLDHLRTLATKLTALSTASQAVMGGSFASSAVNAMTATTSDPATFTVTAGNGAVAGVYDLDVVNLARAQRSGGGAFNAAHDAGTLTIQGKAGTATVNVTAGMSASDLATAINGAAGCGLAATVLGGTLLLVGKQTGAAENYTLAASGGTLSLGDLGLAPSANDKAADDARITLAGTPLASASNTFADAITGVTLTATAPGTGKTLAVARDTTAATAKINAMVSAYNDVIKQITTDTAYDASTKTGGALHGDAFVEGITDKLMRSLSAQVTAKATDNGGYSNYTKLGIGVQRNGTLTVDASKLSAALSANPDAVYTLLANEDGKTSPANPLVKLDDGGDAVAGTMGDGVANRLFALADSLVNPSSAFSPFSNGKRVTGSLLAQIDGSTQLIADFTGRENAIQARLDRYQSYLERKFAAMEKAVNDLRSQGNYLTSMTSGSSS